MTVLSKVKRQTILVQTLEQAFPNVDPQHEPFGTLILLQIKNAPTQTASGLVLNPTTTETEFDNTRVAKVLKLGGGAFKNRTTLERWPEGDWVKPGDYVRIGLYGGDRWRVHYDTIQVRGLDGTRDEKLFTEFALIEDLNLKAMITGDPRDVMAFL
jgi:co-chaperonin GroES (HSP10)